MDSVIYFSFSFFFKINKIIFLFYTICYLDQILAILGSNVSDACLPACLPLSLPPFLLSLISSFFPSFPHSFVSRWVGGELDFLSEGSSMLISILAPAP